MAEEPENIVLTMLRELRQKMDAMEGSLQGQIGELRKQITSSYDELSVQNAAARAEARMDVDDLEKTIQAGFSNLQATVATRADVDALREEVRKLGVESATHSSQIGRVHAAVMGFNERLAKVERG